MGPQQFLFAVVVLAVCITPSHNSSPLSSLSLREHYDSLGIKKGGLLAPEEEGLLAGKVGAPPHYHTNTLHDAPARNLYEGGDSLGAGQFGEQGDSLPPLPWLEPWTPVILWPSSPCPSPL